MKYFDEAVLRPLACCAWGGGKCRFCPCPLVTPLGTRAIRDSDRGWRHTSINHFETYGDYIYIYIYIYQRTVAALVLVGVKANRLQLATDIYTG